MKLRKAKEILDLMGTPDFQGHTEDIQTARIIGSDAIKRILTMRSYNINQAILPLRGETKTNGQNLPEETLKKLRESPLGKKPEA